MYFKEHGYPHFHARAAGREAKIRIDPVEVIDGALDRRHLALVKSWQSCTNLNWKRVGDGLASVTSFSRSSH
jgi:hypothetical protein